MPETMNARRTPALMPDATAGQTRVTILGPAARFSLRVAGACAHPPFQCGGFDLSAPLNQCRIRDGRIAARLGPDEWLLIGPPDEVATLAGACAADLADRVVSLVDVSHRNVAMAVSGPGARAVLNAGIALDLSDAAFPAGSASRTLLGKAEVVLLREGPGSNYRVECWRSFGSYVHGLLTEVVQEFA